MVTASPALRGTMNGGNGDEVVAGMDEVKLLSLSVSVVAVCVILSSGGSVPPGTTGHTIAKKPEGDFVAVRSSSVAFFCGVVKNSSNALL